MDCTNAPFETGQQIVGRAREQDRLRACLGDALEGRGRLVLLSGEAGIGKTTLVRDLTRQAHECGALAFVGASYELASNPPYGPWNEIFSSYLYREDLAQVPPVLLQPDDRDGVIQHSEALFNAVRQFFTSVAASRSLLVVLEDMHWSDRASLDLLRYLSRSVNTMALLLVVTYREDELTRDHPLFQLLPQVVRETEALRLELQRFDDLAIKEMVAGHRLPPAEATRLREYLTTRAMGNPLFTAELLRALEFDGTLHVDGSETKLGVLDETYLPAFVVQVIERRLAGLDAATRQALEAAAVIGQEVPLHIWEAVCGLEPALLARVIAQALEAHVLEETPDRQGLRFAHALVREVLYGSALARRRDLHRRIAEILTERTLTDASTIAYHFQQAGDERAPEWLIIAGLQARLSAAWFSAAEHFQNAAQLLERTDPLRIGVRGWLLLYCGFLLRFSGEPRALEYLDEAEHLATLSGDTLLDAYIHYHRGSARCLGGDIRNGLAELETGVKALEALSLQGFPSSTEEQFISVLREALRNTVDRTHNVVMTSPQRSGAAAQVVPQRGVLVNWLGHAGHYRRALQMGEAFVADVAAAHGEEGMRVSQSVSGLLGLSHAYAALGQPESARQGYESARRGFISIGDHVMLEYTNWVELLMVTLPYRTDQTAERARLLAQAEHAWGRAVGTSLGVSHLTHCRFMVDMLEGRWNEAYELALDGEHAPIVPQYQGAMLCIGILERQRGEATRAWEQVYKLLPEGPHTEPGDSYFPLTQAAQCLAADLALDALDLDLARRWIDAHRRWLEWSKAEQWRGDHLLLLARYHLTAGDEDDAVRNAAASLQHALEPRQPLVLIAAERLLGLLATLGKEFESAERHLCASLDLAVACAAPYERARTLLEITNLELARGDFDAGRSALEEARSLAVPLGASLALERLDQLAAELSARPVGYPAGLTPREAEVLRLLAGGSSNHQIATTLYVSSRTVERHVANIYRKIDAHNRAEATAYALSNGLA